MGLTVARSDRGTLLTFAAVVILVIAVAMAAGVVGVLARLAQIAIAIGGTVMVLGLLGFVGIGAYLMSILNMGPFR
jgi:hypothetical protein